MASTPSASELPDDRDPVPRGQRLGASSGRRRTAASRSRSGSPRTGANSASTRGRACGAGGPGARPGRRARARPDFTAMTGLRRASRRASRANLRGLPKRLQVQQDHVGARVAPPSTAAGRCRRRRPGCRPRRRWTGPARGGRLGRASRCPSAPDWQKKPIRPARRQHRGQRGVQPHRRVGVDDAEAVRPDHPHAVRAGQHGPAAARAGRGPPRPVSAKPAETTTRPRTPLRAQSSTHLGDRSAGTAMTARSTGSGMSATAGVRRDTGDRAGTGFTA